MKREAKTFSNDSHINYTTIASFHVSLFSFPTEVSVHAHLYIKHYKTNPSHGVSLLLEAASKLQLLPFFAIFCQVFSDLLYKPV